jgi:hypothetical protein
MLCGESNKLVKSHIIPEAFWREIRQGDDAPLLITSVKGEFPKKAPIGVYDDGILCTECEESFGHVDDYGITVLLKRRDELFRPSKDGAGALAYVAEDVDQRTLLKFFVSV